MSKFDAFVKGLNDHELAIYVGYQYESFLPYAKQLAQREIESRGLSKERLDKYFQHVLPQKGRGISCERCGSNRFIQDRDIEFSGDQYSSGEFEITTNRCRLCNFNPSKTIEKNLFKRIKRYFFDPNKTTKTLRTYYFLDDKPHYPSDR